jgi:hypothetical protein
MSMTIPHRQTVLAQIGPIVPVFRVALTLGLAGARQYFDDEHEDSPDSALAPNIVRWHARRYLDNAGHAVHDLPEDYDRQPLGNIGLMLVWGRFHFRLRKARDGELPVPASDTQRQFYDQLCLEFDQQDPGEIHLMVLWETDREYTQLTSLTVVLPQQGGTSRITTRAYWSASILEDVETTSIDDDLPMELDEGMNEESGH